MTSMLIGGGIYDAINAINIQHKFRPGSDHNPILGIGIIR